MASEDIAGPETRSLLQKLASEDRALQRGACNEALEELRRNPEFRETLHRLLHEGELRARFAAAFILFQAGRHGEGPRPLHPGERPALGGHGPDLRLRRGDG